MLVYVAYALLVLHVTFGALQSEASVIYATAMASGLATVLGLHIAAARKEMPPDREPDCSSRRQEALAEKSETGNLPPRCASTAGRKSKNEAEGFIDACAVADIPENRARIVCLSGERVAIFKYDSKISAVSNVCQHQNGPLGEGKIVFGCITCPWHGYQYVPETGASPPPFVEMVPTFNVRVKDGRVLIHPQPNPAGMRAEPATSDK
jgi:nitrite reductase/ring-hydroxylating ferredoxin subunit